MLVPSVSMVGTGCQLNGELMENLELLDRPERFRLMPAQSHAMLIWSCASVITGLYVICYFSANKVGSYSRIQRCRIALARSGFRMIRSC
jgi:hypothetical protein